MNKEDNNPLVKSSSSSEVEDIMVNFESKARNLSLSIYSDSQSVESSHQLEEQKVQVQEEVLGSSLLEDEIQAPVVRLVALKLASKISEAPQDKEEDCEYDEEDDQFDENFGQVS